MANPDQLDTATIAMINELGSNFEARQARVSQLVSQCVFLGCLPLPYLRPGDEVDVELAYGLEYGAPRNDVRILHGVIDDPLEGRVKVDRDSFQDGTYRTCSINLASMVPVTGMVKDMLVVNNRAVVDPEGTRFARADSVEHLPAVFAGIAVNDVRFFGIAR